mmetsp:Transcript_13065/g.21050  ORF Transcript_13065/g.21050 Transcript_13065/m.21050 type:complete len:82 (-) Transcript_13065:169-414(-)
MASSQRRISAIGQVSCVRHLFCLVAMLAVTNPFSIVFHVGKKMSICSSFEEAIATMIEMDQALESVASLPVVAFVSHVGSL